MTGLTMPVGVPKDAIKKVNSEKLSEQELFEQNLPSL